MDDGLNPPTRIAALDAVRGFAVLGILLINIVGIGLPSHAVTDPTYYGADRPADLWAWAINYALAEGKMRALFTMLFGASMALLASRTAAAQGELRAAEDHYHRMFWLFVFGMAHAWLFWFGDILVSYALCGAIGFLLWRWPRAQLFWFCAIMFAAQLLLEVGNYRTLIEMQAAAAAPDAASAARDLWQRQLALIPGAEAAAEEVAGYRGSWADAFATRQPMTVLYQTTVLFIALPELFAYLTLGMLLLRTGFLTGEASPRAYRRVIALGHGIALPLHLPLIWLLMTHDFDPVTLSLANVIDIALRPFVALAHAACMILLVRSGHARWLTSRIEAAGRMALTNYLGTTLIATTLFYGYGLGLYGALSRAELYWVVAGIWLLILAGSEPWLDRFRYGPLEWLWRSLARRQWQPMKA